MVELHRGEVTQGFLYLPLHHHPVKPGAVFKLYASRVVLYQAPIYMQAKVRVI